VLPTGTSITFKELHGGFFFAFLNENVQLIAILNDCSPKVMQNTIDLNKYLTQVPHITEFTALLPDLTTILIAELYAPISNGLAAYADPCGGQYSSRSQKLSVYRWYSQTA
jgi:hypothetical protein